MKHWIAIPLAALLGIVAGSWGPREDLKTLRERMSESKSVRQASDASGFGAFAKMVNIPDVARRPAKAKPAKARSIAAARSAEQTEQAEQPGQPEQPRRPHPRFTREDLRARIDEAADLWRTRVELAKTQWKAKLGISSDGKESAAFDGAIERMNAALLETMTALAAEIEAADKMTPELGMRLMGDASRVMAEAYDEFGTAVPPERRGEVSEIPVFEFIDPSVAEPLIGVQDKLDPRWMEPRK